MANVLVEETSLSNIASAIRVKNGSTAVYKPGEMAAAISNLPTGGGDIKIYAGGDISYLFTGWGSNFYNTVKDNLVFGNVSSGYGVFINSGITGTPPFTIPLKGPVSGEYYGFLAHSNVLPNIVDEPKNYASFDGFYSQCNLKKIDFSHMTTNFTGGSGIFGGKYLFEDAHWLREIDFSSGTNLFLMSNLSSMFNKCYDLDAITNLPIKRTDMNFGWNTFYSCCHLKRLTFAQMDEAITPSEYSPTIDLSYGVGYYVNVPFTTNYSIGHTTYYEYGSLVMGIDEQITDATTYAKFKNSPDAWTTNVEYSRYNRTSAVETLSTVPQITNAKGTPTIKFLGNSGSKTDGGAINTMTAEEVAVATSKGWTVTYS